jgi:hypothetical protein
VRKHQSKLCIKSHIASDGQSVCLNVEPFMFVICLTVTVLSSSGALSDQRSDLSFVSHGQSCVSMYMDFYNITCLTGSCIYSQSRFGTADYALLIVAQATTAM